MDVIPKLMDLVLNHITYDWIDNFNTFPSIFMCAYSVLKEDYYTNKYSVVFTDVVGSLKRLKCIGSSFIHIKMILWSL